MICNWNMQIIVHKYWFVNKDSHFYLVEYAIRWRLYQIISFTWYKTNRMNRFPPFFAPYDMEKFCDILFRSTSYSENSGFFGMLVSLRLWCLFHSLWDMISVDAALFSFPKYGIYSIIASTAIFFIMPLLQKQYKVPIRNGFEMSMSVLIWVFPLFIITYILVPKGLAAFGSIDILHKKCLES